MPLYSKPADDVLTVRNVLRSPDFLAKGIAQGLLPSLASRLFGDASTDAAGGTVLYQRISTNDLYSQDDINARAEGTEYQVVRLPEPDIQRDPVEDLGAVFEVTDEAVDRNVLDVVTNGQAVVTNTIRRKLDARIAATLVAAPIPDIVSTAGWGSFTTLGSTPTPRGSQPIGDLIRIDQSFAGDEFGQTLQTLLLNPEDAGKLRLGYGDELPGILAAATRHSEPVKLATSNALPEGTAYALSQLSPGGLGVEKPLTVEILPQRERRTTRIQTYIVARPYISRMFAVRKLVGI
ncbi:major capsid protein [Rhodococcus pyridinivorans]|uniref:major capsid protein n=1 Tax=Rhodococcus pyridinivorans TaxID=103816 RepID=UPI00110DCA85|nr:major capsid protein [Rhodococcus pyridinivorans]